MKNRNVYNQWRAKCWNAVPARVPGSGTFMLIPPGGWFFPASGKMTWRCIHPGVYFLTYHSCTNPEGKVMLRLKSSACSGAPSLNSLIPFPTR